MHSVFADDISPIWLRIFCFNWLRCLCISRGGIGCLVANAKQVAYTRTHAHNQVRWRTASALQKPVLAWRKCLTLPRPLLLLQDMQHVNTNKNGVLSCEKFLAVFDNANRLRHEWSNGVRCASPSGVVDVWGLRSRSSHVGSDPSVLSAWPDSGKGTVSKLLLT